MHTYPTSSGVSSMSAAMRAPDCRIRRCEQMTAFGAADVPLVKIRHHVESIAALGVGVGGAHLGQRGIERLARSAMVFGISPITDVHGRLVARRVEQQRRVGVADVVEQLLAAPRVVDADDRRHRTAPRRRGRRRTRACCRAAPPRGAAGLGRGSGGTGWRTDSTRRSTRRGSTCGRRGAAPAGRRDRRIGGVATEQRGRVRRGQRGLAQLRGRPGGRPRPHITPAPLSTCSRSARPSAARWKTASP